ncbi:sugar ABC transporter permease [candidate division KSB1 bacterium]|nr:sugar ABC transporter permease [candidate division KSB1 bacterium]
MEPLHQSAGTQTRWLKSWRRYGLAYSFILPTVIVLCFFLFFPIVSGLIMSLQATSTDGSTRFVGLTNYLILLRESRFLNNLLLSCIYILGNLVFSLPLAYLTALIISKKFRGTQFFQSAFLLPWIVAPVVSALLFRALVDPVTGPVAALIQQLFGNEILILSDPVYAMMTIIIHGIWRSFPFMMLFLAAGMLAIPVEIYEAARVDGASAWHRFRNITLPLTKFQLAIVLVIITMWTLQDAETIWAMTQGGPGYSTEVAAVRLLKEAFISFHLNTGAAIGFGLVFVGAIFMGIYLRLIRMK